VACHGKGRKDRITPLTTITTAAVRQWMAERQGTPESPLFPTNRGQPMSRDALEQRLARHVNAATHTCPTLATKKITPHVLRHTAAMRLQVSDVALGASFGGFCDRCSVTDWVFAVLPAYRAVPARHAVA
jgi:site-specific recombinase XerD